jgi:hypothetical protein
VAGSHVEPVILIARDAGAVLTAVGADASDMADAHAVGVAVESGGGVRLEAGSVETSRTH